MESSFLYHAFGVRRDYQYHASEYKGNAIYLKLKSISLKEPKCPHCGGEHVIKYGVIHRDIHNLPIGPKKTFLTLTIQRYECKDCERVFQADIPFTHGNVSYTYRFSRYILLFNAYPEIKEAYDLKEEFRTLYWSKKTNLEYKDKEIPVEERNAIKEKVREKLHTWYDHVNASKCPGMKSFKRTIKEREEDLLNYYTTFVTNAHSESLNSGIKALRTEVKGVSDLPFIFFRVCKIFG